MDEALILKAVADLHDQAHSDMWKIIRLESKIADAAEAFESDNKEELDSALKELLKHHIAKKAQDAKEKADRRGVDVELSLKVEEALKAAEPEGSMSHYSLEKIVKLDIDTYKLTWDEESYRTLNLHTGELSVKVWNDQEEWDAEEARLDAEENE